MRPAWRRLTRSGVGVLCLVEAGLKSGQRVVGAAESEQRGTCLEGRQGLPRQVSLALHRVLEPQCGLRLARHGLSSPKFEDHVRPFSSRRRLLQGAPQVSDCVCRRGSAQGDGSGNTERVDHPPAAGPGSREQVLGHPLRSRLLRTKEARGAQVVGGPLALRLRTLDRLGNDRLCEGQGFTRGENPYLDQSVKRGDGHGQVEIRQGDCMPGLAAWPENGDRGEQGRRARVHLGSPNQGPLGNAFRRSVVHQSAGWDLVPLGEIGRESVDEKRAASARLVYLGGRFIRSTVWPALRKRTLRSAGAERLEGAARGVLVSGDVRKRLGCSRGRDRTGGEQDRHR